MSPEPRHTTEALEARLQRIREEERREKLAQVAEDAERDARLTRLLAGRTSDAVSRPERP